MKPRLIFDSETIGDDAAIPFLPPLDPPSNYKSEEAISKWKAEATPKQRAKMSLDPSQCRIVALAWHYDDTLTTRLCPTATDEREALTAFWDVWTGATGDSRIGFNIAFDLPVLLTRSIILGVPKPTITLRKYGSPDCRDLMLDLSFGGLVDYHGLTYWCKRLNLDVPEDVHTGANIADLVNLNSPEAWDAIRHHVTTDVLKTKALADYLG